MLISQRMFSLESGLKVATIMYWLPIISTISSAPSQMRVTASQITTFIYYRYALCFLPLIGKLLGGPKDTVSYFADNVTFNQHATYALHFWVKR